MDTAVIDSVGNVNAFNESSKSSFHIHTIKTTSNFSWKGKIYISQAMDFQCGISNILNDAGNLRVDFEFLHVIL